MTDGTPGATEFFSGGVQHLRNAHPVSRKFSARDFGQCGVCSYQEFADGGIDVSGGDAVKQGKTGKFKQRIVHAVYVACRSADSRVLTSNMVMVMGPTPPGTGVM